MTNLLWLGVHHEGKLYSCAQDFIGHGLMLDQNFDLVYLWQRDVFIIS